MVITVKKQLNAERVLSSKHFKRLLNTLDTKLKKITLIFEFIQRYHESITKEIIDNLNNITNNIINQLNDNEKIEFCIVSKIISADYVNKPFFLKKEDNTFFLCIADENRNQDDWIKFNILEICKIN